MLDEEEMTLEEDDVGWAELEDEVWLEEATCYDCEVSMIDQVRLSLLECLECWFWVITEVCDRAKDFGEFSMRPYLAG